MEGFDFFSTIQASADHLSKVSAEARAAEKELEVMESKLQAASAYEDEVRAYLSSCQSHNAGLSSLVLLAENSVQTLAQQLADIRAQTELVNQAHQEARANLARSKESFVEASLMIHSLTLEMRDVVQWASGLTEAQLEQHIAERLQEASALRSAEDHVAKLSDEHAALSQQWDELVAQALASAPE